MGLLELLLIVGVGLVFCAAVAGLFGYVGWTLMKANQVVAAGATAVRTGQVPDALPWTPTSLTSLSADWVGASTYTRGFGGPTDKASGLVQLVDRPGTAVAFQMSSRGYGADGRLEAIGPARLTVDVAQGVAAVARDGAPLGSVALATGELRAPTGQPIGRLVREVAALAALGLDDGRSGPRAALVLGTAPVALLDARTESHEARPATLRPLVLRYEPRSPDAEPWTLVACLLELGWFGVARTHASLSRRGR